MENCASVPIKIVVVEDDDITRASLCDLISLNPEYVLMAQFGQMQPAMSWIADNSLDILLTDLGLPDGSGIDLIRATTLRWPECSVLVITMFGDEVNVLSSIEAGATGYMLKDHDQWDIARVLDDLRDGGSPMSPLVARKVLTRARSTSPLPYIDQSLPEHEQIQLSKRESATLDLIARGYTYNEVAQLLDVSLSTIQTYIRGIYRKLSVHSRSEAVFEANKLGLLQPGLMS